MAIDRLFKMKEDGDFVEVNVNEISDGYHTFPELYRYRMLYNAALFNEWAKVDYWTAQPVIEVHKSWKHSDGELCFGGGWFIVVAELPTGQISNHYKEEFWDLFKIPEKEIPNEYDGHTPAVAADRLYQFIKRQD
jgi:hypothetical protein